MDKFEVPAIPKIFVPPILSNKSESQSHSNSSKSTSKPSNREELVHKNESKAETTSSSEGVKKDMPPQLCASCSQILLSYFMPLQQYVNEVVQIARGDRVPTSHSLLNMLNTEVLNENTFSEQRNERNSSDNNRNERLEREVSNVYHNPEDNQKPIPHYSSDESNLNRHQNKDFTQSENYSQNQNNSENMSFGQIEGHNQRDSHHQNVSQNPIQVIDSSNARQRENDNTVHSNGTAIEQTATSFEAQPSNNQQISESNDNNESIDRGIPHDSHINDSRNKAGYQRNYDLHTNESTEQTSSESTTGVQQENEWRGSAVAEEDNHLSMSCPNAFVTIAYNNLSATNAIILANSLVLTNNRSMNCIDKSGNKNTIQIPFIILIGGNIDPVLKEAIYMVFDEVISEPMDVKLALLSDQSFGIRQFKLQLWKELQKYEKCLYLESSTLVVGRITNLFEECKELSACVDWLFPDNFNCSVFVFEPSLTTYEQLISFAIFHQKCNAQKDEGVGETLDEMTLLNQFFAPKWNRISFVYNFVKNDAIYTQIPAFMKYGDSIKIVNFGHMMSQTGVLGNQPGMSSVQPWHILFDLLACGQQDVIKAMSIDNYSKFYLNCFIQRLWPILQNHLTPQLVSKYGVGRRQWSIFDLIRLLTNESGIETDDHMFTQTPITFRRIKSPAEKISKYETLSIEDEDDYLKEQMPELCIDEQELEQPIDNKEESVSKNEEQEGEPQQKAPQLTSQQQDERSKREWEAGRIDWMGAHGSDKIINRLKKLIRND